MTQVYADPYLNELQKRIDVISALPPPPDDQGARDRSLLIGKLVMQIQNLKGSKP
jgi:hypothetical protein